MIAIPECKPQSPIRHAFAIPQPTDKCTRELSAAERELGAFIAVVGKLYGEEAASNAAEYWVALVESSFELPSINGFSGWRHITILTASHLAKNGLPSIRKEAQEEMRR
jgi:hypothetical protein